MKLALYSKSAIALRKLGDGIPGAITNITDHTVKLVTVNQSVSDTLGSHRHGFYLMLLHIQKAQTISVEALEILPSMMRKTADKIEAYMALRVSAPSTTSSLSSHASPTTKHSGSSSSDGVEMPKLLSDHEIMERFGIARCKNGTDVFVKGENFTRFEETYYAVDDFPSLPYDRHIELDISPNLKVLRGFIWAEVENPAVFWRQHKEHGGTAESFQVIASRIPEVRKRIDLGAILSELEDDPLLSDCAGIYFGNKPEVIW